MFYIKLTGQIIKTTVICLYAKIRGKEVYVELQENGTFKLVTE